MVSAHCFRKKIKRSSQIVRLNKNRVSRVKSPDLPTKKCRRLLEIVRTDKLYKNTTEKMKTDLNVCNIYRDRDGDNP